MTSAKIALRTSAALILITLMLLLAATTPAATAQTYTVLYNFDFSTPNSPEGPLTQGRDGNLYGTVRNGGAHNAGAVFKITPNGVLTVLHSFDRGTVFGGLTLGTDGNFYGATPDGGTNRCGTIFRITPGGKFTTLHTFSVVNYEGESSVGPPMQAADGNFYGATWKGTVYKMTPSGSFEQLTSLPEKVGMGFIQATDGNFYGVTIGGSTKCNHGCGVVLKISPIGIVTVIHRFNLSDGYGPIGLIQWEDDNFYGTTDRGGKNDLGLVYKMTQQGAITILHEFGDPNYPDEIIDTGALLRATDGNFYSSMSEEGGASAFGTIYRINPSGDYSEIYNFDSADRTAGNLIQHTNGKMYGTGGGINGVGSIVSFDIGLEPFVRIPFTSGKVGAPIRILGQGFIGTTGVSFNGVPATFNVWTDTFMTAKVPSGATSGNVTVTTPAAR